jgi:hypothetical protein
MAWLVAVLVEAVVLVSCIVEMEFGEGSWSISSVVEEDLVDLWAVDVQETVVQSSFEVGVMWV